MLLSLLLSIPSFAEDPDEEDTENERSGRTEIDFESLDLSGELVKPRGALLLNRLSGPQAISATPGGAQDIAYYDRLLEEGQIPLVEQFTAEGLLSEHDLPVRGTCPHLLCVVGQAAPAQLHAQPGITHLAQIGFTSSLTALPRPPLNLVAVVDTSSSMDGEPIDMVKASMRALQAELRPTDQLTIVTFNDTAMVHLEPTASAQPQREAIDALLTSGGTALSAGLSLGFSLAQTSRATFDGLTRVIVLTDERPNIGPTSATGFMGQASVAAEAGIGMTIIGVSAHFGAELAHQISTVRGANLFYFSDREAMAAKFRDELGAMMVPLAYGMALEVTPADGTAIEGLYGLPGSAVEWTDAGGIAMEVATLFPSTGGGGIFLGLSSTEDALATISLSYDPLDGPAVHQEFSLQTVPPRRAWEGLTRGAAVVDVYTTLTQLSTAYHSGASAEAHALAAALLERLPSDPALSPDRERIMRLLVVLDESETLSRRSPMTGLPPR